MHHHHCSLSNIPAYVDRTLLFPVFFSVSSDVEEQNRKRGGDHELIFDTQKSNWNSETKRNELLTCFISNPRYSRGVQFASARVPILFLLPHSSPSPVERLLVDLCWDGGVSQSTDSPKCFRSLRKRCQRVLGNVEKTNGKCYSDWDRRPLKWLANSSSVNHNIDKPWSVVIGVCGYTPSESPDGNNLLTTPR